MQEGRTYVSCVLLFHLMSLCCLGETSFSVLGSSMAPGSEHVCESNNLVEGGGRGRRCGRIRVKGREEKKKVREKERGGENDHSKR